MRRGMRSFHIAALVLLASLSAAPGAQADPAPAEAVAFTAQAEILDALRFSYNLRFNDAKTAFEKMAKAHPETPAGEFYLAAIGWGVTESDLRWQYLAALYTQGDPPKREVRNYAAVAQNLKTSAARCMKILETRPGDFEALFYAAGSYAFLARMEAYRNNYFSAMYYGKKSTRLFESLLDLHPSRGDAMIGPAIYKYHVGRMPKPFQWVIAALGLSGTKEEGVALAEKAYQTAMLSRTEAADFLSRINWHYERDFKKALYWADALDTLAPGTPAADLNRLFIARHSGDAGLEEKSARNLMAKLDTVDPGVAELWRPLMLYIMGDISDRRGNPKEAEDYFRRALASPKADKWLAGFLAAKYGKRLAETK